jgi:F-type H+-transporting ATPase subunit b
VELDWTTFTLEVLNFLVLVWLLKRFFYRPVLNVIEARRAETAKTMADAAAVRSDAQKLQCEYQAHLAKLDREGAAARTRLDEEIASERTRRLEALSAEIAGERERRGALAARERGEAREALEREAMTIAARFAARLLDRVAGRELEARLADLALADLDAQDADKLEALRSALREPQAKLQVLSAYALDEARRAAFSRALGQLAGREVAPEFAEDATLKAGVCIMVGSWVLMANLRDELKFFATAFEHGG